MPNKSKEELAVEMKRVQEAKRMRAFVKNELYPALIAASTSIDDAKYLLGSFSNMVMEQFLALMKEKTFGELKLEEKLDPKNEQYDSYLAILKLFENETVFTARELIEGMKNEIQMLVDNELKERKLDTLKTNWLE